MLLVFPLPKFHAQEIAFVEDPSENVTSNVSQAEGSLIRISATGPGKTTTWVVAVSEQRLLGPFTLATNFTMYVPGELYILVTFPCPAFTQPDPSPKFQRKAFALLDELF